MESTKIKQPVKYSTYSIIITVIFIIAITYIICYTAAMGITRFRTIAVCVLFIIAISGAILYAPLSVTANENEIKVKRLFKSKRIKLNEIETIMKLPPSMTEKRIFGSGGFFGYWGWMREPSIGKYFAYYGKASDAFLVRLNDGRQYLLGCRDCQSIIDFILPGIMNNNNQDSK